MSALTPKDRKLLVRMESDFELTDAEISQAAKLINRLARRIDGPGSKNPGKRARAKGQELQREVANALKPVYPDAASNSQYRGAKRDGCDVGQTPWWIEAKNRKDGSVFTAYRQAMRDKQQAGDTRPVLIATTRNREPVLVAMHLQTFVNLLEEKQQ